MTTLDELFMRSRRTGARPADDAPKRTGDGARAHGDGSTDGTDAPQRPGGPTMAPTPRPARSAATIAEARSAATDATPNAPTPRPADDAPATTWRIRYIDGTERVIAFSPARTRAEVLHAETGAVEVVAHSPGKTPPDRPLLEDERTRILRWLELIGETDPATIAKVLAAAAEDSTARHYYLERFRDWEERAAVAEFDGGLPRQEADRLAAAQSFEATEESRAALRAARQAFGDPLPRP
ncbi:hypothetical protein [Tepidiphilus olei]|uniref:hypothetical protein n=1 Tax=Tepidiphilus olei TaxID=2502184 RepID=UPI00115E5C12|nr:hypothetical protein [Tepidiphilus olei]